MEGSSFVLSQNGENRQFSFTPQLKRMTRLSDMKDRQIVKSPSWPSSPSVPRTELKRDKNEPEYWTLGRRSLKGKVSDIEFGLEDTSPKETFNEIHSILSNMDLGKYYLRGSKNEAPENGHKPLQRSQSVQPQVNSESAPTTPKPFLEGIPSPPETKSILQMATDSYYRQQQQEKRRGRIYSLDVVPSRSSRRVNSKLKELTERLRSSSAPPSPHRKSKNGFRTAPPNSHCSFWKDSTTAKDDRLHSEGGSSTTKTDHNGNHERTNDSNIEVRESGIVVDFKFTAKGKMRNVAYATLPRVKASDVTKRNTNETRTLASLDLNINFDKLRNNTSLEESFLLENQHIETIKHNNLKEDIEKANRNSFRKEHRRESNENSLSEDETASTISRKGSLRIRKNSNNRADFDLNFSNYGSLTSLQKEQSKPISRSGSNTFNKISKIEPKIITMPILKRIEIEDKTDANNPEDDDAFATEESPDRITDSLHTNATHSTRRATNGTRSVPVLPTSFTNPLEEEIRTIAKLLDGKESLFLKLIQSSNNEKYLKEVSDTETPTTSPPSYASIDITSPTITRRDQARASPTRVRAMTVPVDEATKNNAQKSPPPAQKRFYKKRLRGPYGEMLEQEMSKSLHKQRPSYAKELDFLKDLETSKTTQNSKLRPLQRSSSHSLDESHSVTVVDGSPKRKTSANIPVVNQDNLLVPCTPSGTVSEPSLHIRSHSDSVKTASSWNVDKIIEKALKQSSLQDTRTHIVGELHETEVSYVESLHIIVKKYMVPLKSSEHAAEISESEVERIFCQVPEMLRFHETFLESLKNRLSFWDTKQKIGDVFVDVFTKSAVVDTYIEFINNWKSARDAIKSISLAKPAFAKFLEITSREHRGKLTLDALLIMPVQRIPRYELLIKELLKHTPLDHPDHKLLLQAQREVHDLAVRINKVEREALHHEQRLQRLREIQNLVDGIADLTQGERAFIRHDFVLIPGGLGMKKERCVFLFTDILLITSIKKKGAIRKSSISVTTSSSSLESNKYKLLMKTPLHNVHINKIESDVPCVRTFLNEVSSLEYDVATLAKINDMIATLNNPHPNLDDMAKECLMNLNRQLIEKQASGSQLMSVELKVNINEELENINLVFPNPEQRMAWQAAFMDAKDKFGTGSEKSSPPEFLCSLPLPKTRSGLQITCAAPVVDACQSGLPDLWICSSDGYVGQVSVLTFQNEPIIASCTNISNARILCIAAVPGVSSGSLLVRRRSTLLPYLPGFKYERFGKCDKEHGKGKSFPLDSDSDDDDYIDAPDDHEPSDDANTLQPTMWLGTEDGYIYVYNCTDIMLQNVKLRIQHTTCIYDIIPVDEKVFVSLANGEILVYSRDHSGLWNTCSPHRIQIVSDVAPISKMVLVEEKLWCATLNSIAIIDTSSFEIEHTFQAAAELNRHITAIVFTGDGVWVAVQSSPTIHLYHVSSYQHLLEINISAPVMKMLTAYDEIIQQHKSACLRVSSLCVEKDLLWIGTSAGVLLNMPLPCITSFTTSAEVLATVVGTPHGHFGYVRFLTSICASSSKDPAADESGNSFPEYSRASGSRKEYPSSSSLYSALVLCGGDGYEDFGNLSTLEVVGRDDSTNHLLMWRV